MNGSKPNNSESPRSAKVLIYVVDDEPMLLELAAVILQPLGYKVMTFRDPGLALQSYIASQRRPDLLVTDYAMHQMDGLALMEACRKLEPQQKVLLISGTVDESVYRNMRVKPDRFLAKPYYAKQLVDVIEELLAGRQGNKGAT